MQKSLKSAEYARLVEILVAARHRSGVRQQALAKKLGRPQSFIAKYEGGERRIDVVEFIAIARALGADPIKLFREFRAGNPAKAGRSALPVNALGRAAWANFPALQVVFGPARL